jgi:hypothetical protein
MTLLVEPVSADNVNIPSTDPPDGFEEVQDEESDDDDDYYDKAANAALIEH